MAKPKNGAFSTRAAHAGELLPRGDYFPVTTPIVPSVGFLYESMDDLDGVLGANREGYVYSRYGSPTVNAFEVAVANLEGGEAAFAYASGMAALHGSLLAAGVRAGTNIVAAVDLYGATFTLLTRLFKELGATTYLVDVSDLAQVETKLAEARPVVLLAETISNPLLKIADVPALADLAHRYGARLLIDNTFATPYLFNPLAYGADIVVHSATKYLGGHGDVTAGVAVTSAENRARMFDLNKLVGGILGPFEAWLALRGLKTLPLRMSQQCANAARIAQWLANRPEVTRINYPGLASHPQHELAQRLLGERGYGGILSFELANADRARVFKFMEALQLCLPATTLGDIYTLVLHPATASHRSLTDAEKSTVGIREGLVRVSAGIEAVEDILEDLEQALLKTRA